MSANLPLTKQGGNVNSASSTELEAREFFRHYLDAYFARRDLAETMLLFAPSATGFGTGLDEQGLTVGDLRGLYARDIRQAPERIHYAIMALSIHCPAPNTAVIASELNIVTTIAGQELKLNGLRLSLTLCKRERWLIEHMHISFPTEVHDSGESFPLKELEERNKVLRRMVEQKTGELRAAMVELGQLANLDKLTGLYNRLKLDAVLEEELQRSKRYCNPFSVLLLDVDNFKQVNDCFGHLAGDRLLRELADLLRSRVRAADIVGRWGGEEFLVLCRETPLPEARLLALDLVQTIRERAFSVEVQITASLGVASYIDGDLRESLISRADKALYEAKRQGRDRVISEKELGDAPFRPDCLS